MEEGDGDRSSRAIARPLGLSERASPPVAAHHGRALLQPHGEGEEARGGEAPPPIATRGMRAADAKD